MKILFTGGGTGGHILPIIALARELRAQRGTTSLELFYMGPKDNFAQMLLVQEGIKMHHVLSGKIERYDFLKSLPKNLLTIFIKVPLGIVQAFFRIFPVAALKMNLF